MTLDLSKIKSDTRLVKILHPATGEPTGLEWELAALDDQACKVIERQITNKRNKLAARGKVFTADEISENEVALITAASKSWKWTGEASWSGEKLPFNAKNIAVVLEAAWLRDQIKSELDDFAAFFR